MAKKKILLIDAFGLIFKAYYAFLKRPLFNKNGENTSAVFGFFKSILSVLNREKPDYYLVALEGEGECFRNQLYPEYKANRPEAPEDLKYQVPKIFELLKLLNIPHLAVDTFEADDVIGSVANRLEDQDYQILILSNDKDLRQLVTENISICKPDKGLSEYIIMDSAGVKEVMGIPPEQVVDYLAIVGDSSDNIPGVAGIGDKGAQKLLSSWANLDEIYQHIEEITPPGIQKKLLASKENAFLSQELATIKKDIEMDLLLSDLERKPFTLEKGWALLQQEDLKSLIRDFDLYNQEHFQVKLDKNKAEEAIAAATEQQELKDLKELEAEYHLAACLDDIKELVACVEKAQVFCFDLETTGFDFYQDQIICLSICCSVGKELKTWVVPYDLSDEQVEQSKNYGRPLCLDQEYRSQLFPVLKNIFESQAILKIGHNIKFDIKFLKPFGIHTDGPLFDTMLAEYCLDALNNILGMKELAEKYLGFRMIHYEDVVEDTKKETLLQTDLSRLVKYSGQDALITYQLYDFLKEKLRENEKIKYLFDNIEMPLVKVLTDMEYQGVKINSQYLEQLSEQLSGEINDIYQQMAEMTEKEFNPNSPIQLREILFEELGLPIIKKTKSGPSTDVDVLKKLAVIHAFPGLLLDHRQLSKIKSTYSDSLPGMVNPQTKRIHTTYMQTGTHTGRVASKDPNLQNIPIRSQVGRQIRQAFVPQDGYIIISADYSQIELFLLAEFSQDPTFIYSFQHDEDIHRKTASLLFDTSLAGITKEQRSIAKAVNFGILYGQSGFSLAEDLNIPVGDATRFIKRYFEKYAGVKSYIESLKEKCRTNGYAETFWGRKRSIPEINDKNRFRRAYGERMAVNTTIQGTAADLIKIAMTRIHKTIKDQKMASQMIMQVHDELIFEIKQEEQQSMIDLIKKGMEDDFGFKLPLKTSVEIGNNWGELH
ncbi:MAG: DNA polymerase I [Spirochaetes bacterium]|nr:DNA polymerase I [Spirochaetota bacterium]